MSDETAILLGDAYILLEVDARGSNAIASSLSERYSSAVRCAAAVWGPWDVIARVKTNSARELLDFIDTVRKGDNRIKRSETWWIRHDQPQHELPGVPERLAFVMLRVDPRHNIANVINETFATNNDGARVWHVAGVLGSYDIAAMISYDDEVALADLVMERLQGKHGIEETLTIPTIAEMVYPKIARGRWKKNRVLYELGAGFEKHFPLAANEIGLSEKCHGSPTASVFHLMRALELGINAVALSLGTRDPSKKHLGNWFDALKKIEDEIRIRNRGAPRGWLRQGDGHFFGDVWIPLSAVRPSWRNETMHAGRIFKEEDVELIQDTVCTIMKKLASRMGEDGEPKA